MILKSFDLANSQVKFVFLSLNRNVAVNKPLRSSIAKRGVLSPITVIPVAELDDDVSLIDPHTKCSISKSEAIDYFAIIEGQHRFTELTYLISMKEKGKIAEVVNTKLNCLIVSKDEVGNVNEYIIELNSCSKNWKSYDYIENATEQLEEDLLIKTVNKFKMHGFSISTISRFICFDPKAITNKTLADYTNSNGKVGFRNADPIRAIKLYKSLSWMGFTDSFIKKRYLIDFIIYKFKVSKSLNPIMAKIGKLTHAGELSSLREKDCDITVEIESVVEADFADYVKKFALTSNEIRDKENQDCFVNYDHEDVCEFLDCDEDIYNRYYSSQLESA
ncbi:MAG: hypothetical protein NC301_02820 [Bacteroides sp.]|nr:hypothetical protein [Lachnospiraceae bacterium]MCM1309943.1 hypothetical protein [Bacteroides sp.]MCM1379665.1 hypothetical protein [Bacteroides sp.]MCM1445953.1 hypothetical protein [Prevotella sp.]